ncbi:hypothetical protein [Stutzerimonas stutzeri]|uniref:hypothetical protein n=1 Tax=Stutzerimonas stutzeri TaxID=316 RepID=UPI003015482D
MVLARFRLRDRQQQSEPGLEANGQSPVAIATDVNDGMQFVTDSDWAKVTSQGLQEVTAAIGKKLEASK